MRRGQATLELAIGTVLFVSLLIGGLHLAETQYLSLKVQEASQAAMWEASRERIHDFQQVSSSSGIYAPYTSAPVIATARAQNRYRFFDAVLWRSSPQRLFTRGGNLTVSCNGANPAGLDYAIPAGSSGKGADTELSKWFQDKGQVTCAARALAFPVNLPTGFGTTAQGFFNHQQLGPTAPLQLCGIGPTVSFSCPGTNAVLLGDWSMDGPKGSELNMQHPLSALRPSEAAGIFKDQTDCATSGFNKQLCFMAKALFEKTGSNYGAGQTSAPRGAAAEYAYRIGGPVAGPYNGSPYNEKKFAMSFVGVEGDDTSFKKAGLPFQPYVDEVAPWTARTRDPRYNPGCDACHFNAAGTAPVELNPIPAFPNDSQIHRCNCFLGLDTSGCAAETSGNCQSPRPHGTPKRPQ